MKPAAEETNLSNNNNDAGNDDKPDGHARPYVDTLSHSDKLSHRGNTVCRIDHVDAVS